MNPEIKKEVTEEITETWVEAINFNHLFRIKTKKGLYSPITQRNKSGMGTFEEFLNPKNKVTCLAGNTICLGNLKFSDLSILEIFRCIENNIEIDLKDYELNQSKNWFDYLKEKMTEFVEEGEKKMEKED